MATIKDTLAYLLLQYPHKSELSNARVTKMVYLADWHHVLKSDRQVTEILWFYDNYGPFVWDVKDTAEAEKSLFRVASSTNFFGNPKFEFEILDDNYQPRLSDSERESLDHVIESTKRLGWDSFIRIVYSTYPIVSSQRYSFLNLQKKAAEYRQQKTR
ncbi:MAG TPA: Panacea domain-containing protein [Pyrinomonadaceae bacterium]|jgi:hypothetical protein|nr:Panacea domain-containing protein [Pyrinomonadaceae bacterium]